MDPGAGGSEGAMPAEQPQVDAEISEEENSK